MVPSHKKVINLYRKATLWRRTISVLRLARSFGTYTNKKKQILLLLYKNCLIPSALTVTPIEGVTLVSHIFKVLHNNNCFKSVYESEHIRKKGNLLCCNNLFRFHNIRYWTVGIGHPDWNPSHASNSQL